MNYFITAIGTDCGKTLASAIVTKALHADYWKPVQTGVETDAEYIHRFLPTTVIHPEQYHFQLPASPHAAAAAENKSIELDKIKLPTTKNNLIIEGAGGVLVPLNQHDFVIDIAIKLNLEVILVCRNYLGCINHTLLTSVLLKQKNIKVKGIIFNGEMPDATKTIILHHTKYEELLHIMDYDSITVDIINTYADKIKSKL